MDASFIVDEIQDRQDEYERQLEAEYYQWHYWMALLVWVDEVCE